MARLSRPSAFDRFARRPREAAWLVLVAIVVMLAAAGWTASSPSSARVAVSTTTAGEARPGRDRDLELYERIAARVRAGDSYYAAAVEEQRAGHYPVRPGVAVRLPTLAYLTAYLGTEGMFVLAALLGLAVLAAWWQRLDEEPGGADRRILALLLLVVGGLAGLKPQYIVVHEVWAGLLLALAGGLHRPGKWRLAWLAVALALAIREHALPFVLLLAAFAAARRDWPEFSAWALLVALFAAGLAWHLHEVAKHTLANDLASPPWIVFRGLGGWTGNIVDSSVLHLLPRPVAAPLALLPLVGWAGWKTRLGAFYTLLFAGYGLLFMIAGRSNNFYWALVVTPAWFVGLAFVPMAVRSLLASAGLARS